MGKKAKEHRKKVAKRNRIIAQERKRFEKMSQELLTKMYEQSNNQSTQPTFNLPNMDGPLFVPTTEPIINSTVQSGPII
jgi:hypothetical protein